MWICNYYWNTIIFRKRSMNCRVNGWESFAEVFIIIVILERSISTLAYFCLLLNRQVCSHTSTSCQHSCPLTQKHKHMWEQTALVFCCSLTSTGANMCLTHMLFYFFFVLCFLETTQAVLGRDRVSTTELATFYPAETDVPGRCQQTTDLQTDRFAEKEKCCVWEWRVSLGCKQPVEACKTCC